MKSKILSPSLCCAPFRDRHTFKLACKQKKNCISNASEVYLPFRADSKHRYYIHTGCPLHRSHVDSRNAFGLSHSPLLCQRSMTGYIKWNPIVVYSSPIQMSVSTTKSNFAIILSLHLKKPPFGPSAHKPGGGRRNVLVFEVLFFGVMQGPSIRPLLSYNYRPWASRNEGPQNSAEKGCHCE